MAATPLSRFELQNGVPLSVTLDGVYPLKQTEFFLLYTVSAVQYGDIFSCEDFLDQLALIESYQQNQTAVPSSAGAGSGSGTTLNAVLSAGGPTSTAQPQVTSVTRAIS